MTLTEAQVREIRSAATVGLGLAGPDLVALCDAWLENAALRALVAQAGEALDGVIVARDKAAFDRARTISTQIKEATRS